jgi:hypothetical protein
MDPPINEPAMDRRKRGVSDARYMHGEALMMIYSTCIACDRPYQLIFTPVLSITLPETMGMPPLRKRSGRTGTIDIDTHLHTDGHLIYLYSAPHTI